MREDVLACIRDYFEKSKITFRESALTEPIFDSGLDSLDFAALVAKLEVELGFDPFAQSELAVYPQTLEAFVDVYVGFGN